MLFLNCICVDVPIILFIWALREIFQLGHMSWICLMSFNCNVLLGFILKKRVCLLGISCGCINLKIAELVGFMFFCRFSITSVIVLGEPNFMQNKIMQKNQISQKPTCNLKITQNYLMTMNMQKTRLKRERKRKK